MASASTDTALQQRLTVQAPSTLAASADPSLLFSPLPERTQNSPNYARKAPPKRYGVGSMSTEIALEAALEIQQILSKPAAHTTASMPQLPPSTRTPISSASFSMPAIASPKPNPNIVTVHAQRPPSAAQRPPSVAAPAIVNVQFMRRGNMSSPVPVKLGVPITIASYEAPDKATSSSNDDEGDASDSASSYSSTSDADDDLTSRSTSDSEDVNEFPVTVFASSPPPNRKQQHKFAARLPKLGSSLSNIHHYMHMAAPGTNSASVTSPGRTTKPIAISSTVQEQDDEEDDMEEVTPPQRIPNPVPRNSPFWDRTNVNGAELNLFSIAVYAPFGEDEDRAIRRMRVLGLPMPPPPNDPSTPPAPAPTVAPVREEAKPAAALVAMALPSQPIPVAAATSPRAIASQGISETTMKAISFSPSATPAPDTSSPTESLASGPLKDSPTD